MKADYRLTTTAPLALAVFVAVSWLKAPALYTAPRMWSEEGNLYFGPIQSLDLVDSLTLVVRANIQFLTNAIVYLAAQVPLAFAAHVTTYLSFAIAAFTAHLIVVFCASYGIRQSICLAAVVIWALLPPTYEVFATATNAQWVCSLSMLLICALPPHVLQGRYEPALYIWAIACGLTGVPSCIAAPGFFLRGVTERSRPHLVIGVILGLCALVQLAIIVTHPIEGRSFAFAPLTLALPGLLQTVLAPIISADLADLIGVKIRSREAGADVVAAAAVLVSLLLICLAAALAWSPHRRGLVVTLLVLWALESVLNTFGAFGGYPEGLISGWGGARYYLFGCVCFLLLLLLGTRADDRLARRLSVALICLMAGVSIAQMFISPWTRALTEGPSWAEQVERCDPARPCVVTVWPGGAEWTFEIRQRDRAER
jgi:hypothetical protein